tara:strand:- start:3 stop:200 length:198 start_codon:yes stop_codon:yes gene_type:complete
MKRVIFTLSIVFLVGCVVTKEQASKNKTPEKPALIVVSEEKKCPQCGRSFALSLESCPYDGESLK